MAPALSLDQSPVATGPLAHRIAKDKDKAQFITYRSVVLCIRVIRPSESLYSNGSDGPDGVTPNAAP